MKNKILLIIALAIGLLSSNCLEGMDKKSLSALPDDCICEILGFFDKEKTFLDFGLTSRENRNLVNTFWTNKSYFGNRVIKIEYNNNTKESFLKFCKKYPDWPYSIKFENWPYSIKFEKRTTTDDVNKVLRYCKKIKSLDLGWCVQVKCGEVNWKDLERLEMLSLFGADITAGVLNEKILSVCTKLKELDLGGCKQIMSWRNIPWWNLPDLENLNLGWTCITVDDLTEILRACPKLKYLNLSGCNKITSWKNVLWFNVSDLEELLLNWTSITADVLDVILVYCKKLKKIDLGGCLYVRPMDAGMLMSKHHDSCEIVFNQ